MKACSLLLIGAALLVLSVSPALAAPKDDFAASISKTGKEFKEARNRFLANPADKDFLKDKLDSKSWQERLAALILQGWQQHKKHYVALLAEPKVADQTGQTHFPWSRGLGTITADDVPLMYELLLKDTENAADDAARALQGLAHRKPETPLDVKLLHEALRAKSGLDRSSREATAWLLGALPAKFQDKKELLKTLEAEAARKDANRSLAMNLLGGLEPVSDKLSSEQKDDLTSNVLAMKGLKGLIGPVALTRAVGGIGGEKATKEVVGYLAKATKESEKSWALDTLSRAGSPGVALPVLLRYADNANEDLRLTAMAGLGKMPKTAAEAATVAAKLEALGSDDSASRVQTLLAARSLETLAGNHPKAKKEIKQRILNISGKVKNKDLKKKLENILSEFK